jgi:hypothetical protein
MGKKQLSKIPQQGRIAQLSKKWFGRSVDTHGEPGELSEAAIQQVVSETSQPNTAPADATSSRRIASKELLTLQYKVWACCSCGGSNLMTYGQACSTCRHVRCSNCPGSDPLETRGEDSRKSVDTHQGPGELSAVTFHQPEADLSHLQAAPSDTMSMLGSASAQLAIGEALDNFKTHVEATSNIDTVASKDEATSKTDTLRLDEAFMICCRCATKIFGVFWSVCPNSDCRHLICSNCKVLAVPQNEALDSMDYQPVVSVAAFPHS